VEGRAGTQSHDASASALGYLYQSELALLELVRRSKDEPTLALSIEMLDDVAFESAGSATELLQAKHHLQTRGSLSNASSDLWKTLTAWIDALESGAVDLDATRFNVATTGSASPGSAASLLRADDARNPEGALEILERTARTSTNADQQAAYQRFLRLNDDIRLALIESVTVLDGTPTIPNIPSALELELRFASEARFRRPVVERLLGWWHRRVIAHLLTRDLIYAEEIEQEIDALRDQFKSDNLPIDIGRDDVLAVDLSAEDRAFVWQLQLIAATLPTIELAIRDYKRAFLQRSRWISDQLVTDSDLHAYEERLIDEWEHQFAYFEDIEQAEDAMREAGLTLYHELQDRDLWIRPRCQERFVSRGSYHELADQMKVGWHPDFVARLRSLLAPADT
jgi:hypothetical protein